MDLLSKIFEGVVGLLPQAVASLLPEHLKRQALERVGDHNPLKSNPANQDLIRAARLAWIEAAQEVLKASLALSRREELRDQETSIADFNELMQKLLQNDRDLALDRRKDAGPSAIDIHVQAVFDGVRESNADGRPSAMRAGVTAKFTTTLASLSGWPEKEIPPIYQQIATEGVPGPSGRPQPFGDFMMGAFAELIKDPKK